MELALAYKIVTPRLTLRCYEPADIPLLHRSIVESLDHLLAWLPWAREKPSEEAWTEAFVRKCRGQFDLGQNAIYGIFNPSGALIGGTGLHNRIGPEAREIGYWIHVDHTGSGYATEAVLALLKVGFEIEKHERIEIHCAPGNLPSRRIPEKLGFSLDRILPDLLTDPNGNPTDRMVWALSAEAYAANAPKLQLKAYDFRGRAIIFP